MRLVPPSFKYLASYVRMREATLPTCAERYILPEDPFAPRPVGFVPSVWRWAVDDGEVVGVLNVRRGLNGQLERWGGHIGIAVSAKRRREGIGKRMLRLGVRIARNFVRGPLLITVERDNASSLRMVASAAFENGWSFSARLAPAVGREVWHITVR